MRITERDRALLSFAAEHRLVLTAHVDLLLGVTPGATRTRLAGLVREGLLRSHAILDQPGRCFAITGTGLASIASGLAAPRFDPRGSRHDVGLAWLWLAASRGAFGPVRELVSERRMRSSDGEQAYAARTAGATFEPYAVRLGGLGAGGRERLHYPDLLLARPDGGRVAVELELTPKSRTRRERILAGYGADRRIAGVLYLVEQRTVGRGIASSAARFGLDDRVRVQPVRFGRQAGARPPARVAERESIRAGGPTAAGAGR